MNYHKPPYLLTRFFKWFCKESLQEGILGDLEEQFEEDVSVKGLRKAKWRLSLGVIRFFRPGIIKSFGGSHRLNNFGMFQNYVNIAFRNVVKNRTYMMINMLGIGIAFSCCITMYTVLAFNIEFDNFFKDQDLSQVYRVHTRAVNSGEKSIDVAQAPFQLAPMAVEELAGIEKTCRLYNDRPVVYNGRDAFRESVAYADSTFFDIFSIPLIHGSHESFQDVNSIFISQYLSKKYFDDENPIGKTISLELKGGHTVSVTVKGVFPSLPINTSFMFRALTRIEHFEKANKADLTDPSGMKSWENWREVATFFKISPNTNPDLLADLLTPYVELRNNPYRLKFETVKAFSLKPFSIPMNFQQNRNVKHLRSKLPMELLTLSGILAIFILLIACFNLTNTSLAMMSKRLKEIGVRKVIGATRGQIVFQFLLETILVLLIAILVGLAIAQVVVPAFYDMWSVTFEWESISFGNLTFGLILLILITAMLVGIYPALLNSRFSSLALIKGTVNAKGNNLFTNSLMAMQFAISIITLVTGITFIQNTKFQESLDFGYDKEMLLTKTVENSKDAQAYINVLASNPKILSLSKSNGHIGAQVGVGQLMEFQEVQYRAKIVSVGDNYFQTVGLNLIQGRNFNSRGKSGGATEVIVNEAFIEKAGIEDPIGQKVMVSSKEKQIIGVVENHVDKIVRSGEAEPFVFSPSDQLKRSNFVIARTEESDIQEVNIFMEDQWKELFPNKPSKVEQQEDIALGIIRRVNGNVSNALLFITILGVLLSISGIFSLASITSKRRIKEMGIRKTMGASVNQLVGLVNRPFIKIMIFAGILGTIGGFFISNFMLSTIYSYHMDVEVFTIVLCVVGIFAAGIGTTSYIIRKTAQLNPADTLRDE
ncbi:MAG: ABC transporter permease [Cyclobacteriaceae bacterium]